MVKRNLKLYKAIIFDLDNTLLNFELCERQAILGPLNDCAVPLHPISEVDFLEVFESYNSKYWQQRHRLTPNELIKRSYQDTLDHLKLNTQACSCLSERYWHIFNNSGILEPDAIEVLQSLSSNYQLAIISNGLMSAQGLRLKAAGIDHFFEAIIISEAVGYSKPDPQIFHHTLTMLNLLPTSVLYIGDSLKYDYEGARAAGIDFCYYNRKQTALSEGATPKFVVERLLDILKIAL